MIIGQKNILNYVDNLTEVPHFIVFIGSKGSGKTTLATYIADKLNATFSVCGTKVDEIREVIDTAYHTKDPIVYCIRNADTMRAEAKNAMLKITEEPPENAWFIMTVEDDGSLLDTIKSRALVIYLEPYSKDELSNYYKLKYDGVPRYIDIATTPYEVDMLQEYGQDFIDYVELVVDNIAEVASANAFKSANKLALKKDEGYDLKLFWNTFVQTCLNRLDDDVLWYSQGVCETLPYVAKVQKLGVNKQQLYDSWVFSIREVWV